MQIRNGELIDGRYRVEQEASISGFTESAAPVRLYNAIDEQLERPVTLQFLSAAHARDPEQLQLFVQHGRLAAALHHPHIAGVYDAGEWNGWPYWVMARLADTSLQSLYRHQSPAPDVGLALLITRQTAEALQALRDAGMTSWTFSHQAVRVSQSGDPCLYPIEGLDELHGPDAEYASSRPEDDPRALSGMLRVMLAGTPDPLVAGTRLSSLGLPTYVLALLDRMYLDDAPDRLTGAGAVAAAIAGIEAAALQPTEAYNPAQPPQPEEMPLAMPYYGPADDAPVNYAAPALVAAGVGAVVPSRGPDAPTLAAPVPAAQETRATAPVHVQPYVPPAVSVQPQTSSSRKPLFALLPLLALLLVGIAAALWPRLNTASGSAPGVAPTVGAAQLIAVPDVRGKTLEEANSTIGFAGLSMRQAEPVHDAGFSANTVAQQVPAPNVPLQPGSPVTITLSLGPEPTPVPVQPTEPPSAQPNPQPQESTVQPVQPENKPKPDMKDKDEEKDDEKNKDKEKDKEKDNDD